MYAIRSYYALETFYIQKVKENDSRFLEYYRNNPQTLSRETTNFSIRMAENTLSEWQGLYRFLFTRFMDGNCKETVPGQRNPKLDQPGYGEAWYRKIVEETGDSYRFKATENH